MRYVLLYPTGQLGWHLKIPYQDITNKKCLHVTYLEYLHYQLFIHPEDVESNHPFMSGKLFHEQGTEGWAIGEQKNLRYITLNQTKLRTEVYQGLVDAVAPNVDADLNELSKRVILPSSFAGSTWNMQQHLQDAFAINCYYGGGDLFITMTANPKWPELTANA